MQKLDAAYNDTYDFVAMSGGIVPFSLTQDLASAMPPGAALYSIVDYKDSNTIDHHAAAVLD